MVPVPDSQTMMALPVNTLNHIEEQSDRASHQAPMCTIPDNEQRAAMDLLNWDNGIGTLDGCDLRFKINQLGCLELIDSDDEYENKAPKRRNDAMPKNIKTNKQGVNRNARGATNGHQMNDSAPATGPSTSASNLSVNNSYPSHNTNNVSRQDRNPKHKPQQETIAVRQISPGSSLLRDGPNTRRSRPSVSGAHLLNSSRNQTNSLLRKIEQNQNLIILDKLIPRQKIDEIKPTVDEWSVENVKQFIDSIPGCAGCGELFELQQVDGKSLLYLDQKDLLDHISVKLGPAVKIYNAISLLK